jgi:prepilin-type N-terminal cleavage/methylation domain-containing protein
MIYKEITKQKGFSLIESLVSIAIFSMVALAVYQSFFLIYKDAGIAWENTTISSLAREYLENARNIPYAQIGTTQGNPHGSLPDSANPNTIIMGNTSYQLYFEITYMDDPADGTAILGTDPAPDDYKQVKLSVKNIATGQTTNFVTNIVPSGLENMASGGALNLIVINGVGQPIPGANINITNNNISPSINLTRTSDSSGRWVEVGLPPSSNSYHVAVTKSGYSSDQTYPITAQNPSPTKPDATILNGQVSPIISFSLDQVSNLTFNTLNRTCGNISGVGLEIKGAKIIGTPNVLKYDNTFTSNGSGQIVLNNIEADNYTPGLIGNTYMIYGSSPIQQININPNTTQLFNLILGPKTNNSLLVIAKDASGNPIEGANVTLTNASPIVDTNAITGGSLWLQQYWNGGPGQSAWSDQTQYWQDDGGINTNDAPLAMRLLNNGSNTLVTSGWLDSSTFDTGSDTTTYTTFNWAPASQDPAATAKFQIASNNDNTTWNFIGPDGTNATYYTTPGTTISSSNNNNRYIRYRAFLSTTDNTKNPTVTSVGINYVSGCFTPGQVIFPGLTSSPTYNVTVSVPGFPDKIISNLNVSGYQVLQVSF